MSGSPFDACAETYDREFTSSPIGILQRKRVYSSVLPLLRKSTKVLEINCGTGYDAVEVAKSARNVYATDVSFAMIRQARIKKERSALSNLEFGVADIKELPRKINSSYDFLFSNFGGLNCLSPDELKDFAVNTSPYISDNGTLALVLMGKKCIWENVFFYLRNDERAFRRNNKDGLKTVMNGVEFKTWYYSPAQIEGIFSEHYTVKKIKPIGLFIPPSYLNHYFRNRKWILFIFKVLEKIFGHFSFFADFSDHYLIILKKK